MIACYNLILACVWIGAIPLGPVALPFAGVHVVAAALPWLLVRAPERIPCGVSAAREIYPFLALALFWTELGVLQEVRRIPPHDAQVAAWDLALFGAHPHQVWSAAMPAAWLSELMYGAYFSYYLILILPPLALALTGRVGRLREVSLRAMATYLGCFLCYVAFPVYGPHSFDPGAAVSGAPGVLHSLVDRARESGDSPGTAFPSSHVAGALTMAFTAWRWFPRPIGVALIVLACLVAPATIYTGNHYGIDALAGVLLAVVAQGILVPALVRIMPRRA
jgi:membrane-associated phospholipid phosphatase